MAARVIVVAILLTLLACLLAALALRRGRLRPVHGRGERWTLLRALVAIGVLGGANVDLLRAVVERPVVLSGDLRSHALVAREIAIGHANSGWIDGIHAGFPLGPHYPMIGILLVAAFIRVGLSPPFAVMLVGVIASLSTSVLVVRLSMRVGASFAAALTGAVMMAWITPVTSFIGTSSALLFLGVLSQVVAMPLVVLYAHAVLSGRGVRGLVVFGVLVVLAHPQIAVAATLVLVAAALACGARTRRRRLVGAVVQAITAIAVFGPGVTSLHVPFGWPQIERWRVYGHPAHRFFGWLVDGELLDFAQPPVITTIVACAVVLALATARRRPSRVVLAATIATLALASSGEALSSLGRVGAFALSFVQPLRVYALLPLVVGALVIVGVSVVEAHVRGLAAPRRRSFPMLALALPSVAALAFAARIAIPRSIEEWHAHAALVQSGACGRDSPARAAIDALAPALRSLPDGRFVYPQNELTECAAMTDLDFEVDAPIGAPVLVGAHVGVMADAFGHVDLDAPGGARRADVLGIGTSLHSANDVLLPPEAWHERARSGALVLSERIGGASYFAVGCVGERWRGNDAALRGALTTALSTHDPALEAPTRFVELTETTSALATREPSTRACDLGHTTITASRRVVPGWYEADVIADAPSVLVLKETAYRTWNVELDGAAAPFFMVATGFIAVDLAPGMHHVVARTRRDALYLIGVAAAFALVGLVGFWASRKRRVV
ncbi:hypothetical protein BH09MYX1_BH09MYX1_11570 [soil metagenome]